MTTTYHDDPNVHEVPKRPDELPLEVSHFVEFLDCVEYEEHDEYNYERDVDRILVVVVDQLEGVDDEGGDDATGGRQLEQKPAASRATALVAMRPNCTY